MSCAFGQSQRHCRLPRSAAHPCLWTGKAGGQCPPYNSAGRPPRHSGIRRPGIVGRALPAALASMQIASAETRVAGGHPCSTSASNASVVLQNRRSPAVMRATHRTHTGRADGHQWKSRERTSSAPSKPLRSMRRWAIRLPTPLACSHRPSTPSKRASRNVR